MIEHGGVDGHDGMDEQGVHAGSVGQGARHGDKWIFVDAYQREEEDQREGHDGRGIRGEGSAKGAGFDDGKKYESG